eukprot:3244436-Prymnesium_polylepis.1
MEHCYCLNCNGRRRSVLFLGDSVSAQHECDFRCQLAPWFAGAHNGVFHFAGNVKVRYAKAGWSQCGPSPEATEAMKSADLVTVLLSSMEHCYCLNCNGRRRS